MKSKQKQRRERRKVSAQRRVESHSSNSGFLPFKVPKGMKVFYFEKTGKYKMDFIPYEVGKGNPSADEGSLYFERTYWRHDRIGADEKSVICPKKTWGQKCPICEQLAKEESKKHQDEDAIKALKPKRREVYHIIDTDNPDEGVQLFEISFYLFGELLDERIDNADEDENFDMFADLEEGSTLKLAVIEDSIGKNKFKKVSSIDFKERETTYDEDILENTTNLDTMIEESTLSYKQLKKLFLAGSESGDEDDDDEDEDDEEEAPRSKKKRRRDDDEDDEEDEEEDEEDDDEEEAPRSKKKRRK